MNNISVEKYLRNNGLSIVDLISEVVLKLQISLSAKFTSILTCIDSELKASVVDLLGLLRECPGRF